MELFNGAVPIFDAQFSNYFAPGVTRNNVQIARYNYIFLKENNNYDPFENREHDRSLITIGL